MQAAQSNRRASQRDRVLLLNPPHTRAVFRDHYCSSEAKSTYLWHPLDLLIQSGALTRDGYEAWGLDAIALNLSAANLQLRVRANRPRHAVVLVSARTWESDRATLAMLREEGVETITASGDFLRFGEPPCDDARTLVDFVLTDFTSTALGATLREGRVAGGGIATVDDVIAKRVNDLGRAPLDYPTPDPHFFSPAEYRLPYAGFTRFASILTTYGCPHHCLYCHVGELGVRLRSEELLLNDIETARRLGFQQIYFRDATLNAKRSFVLSWSRAMARRGLSMPWSAFATALPMDGELAEALVASGCKHLQLGVETLDDGLRDANGKPYDGEAHRQFVQICNHYGINVTAHLVLGLPGESEGSIRDTIDRVAAAGFHYVAVNIAEDRPGVPWREKGVALPVSVNSATEAVAWRNGITADPAIAASPFTHEQLLAWQSLAYRRFYLRPSRLAREVVDRVRHRDLSDGLYLARSMVSWAGNKRATGEAR